MLDSLTAVCTWIQTSNSYTKPAKIPKKWTAALASYMGISMAKRIFKSERIKSIIKNIADDFRFSQEIDEHALLFYKADTEGAISGKDIDDMNYYLTTGLEELKNNIQWRQEYLSENAGMDEIKLLENMKTIEEEYVELQEFLK